MTMTRPFGSSIKRVEDPRFITGRGRYTANFVRPGMTHMAVTRSPFAHALITSIDTSAAASMPGVLGVFTGADMTAAGFGGIPCAWVVPDSNTKTPEHPPIAIDKVRYVGDAVAIVIAETDHQAHDAAIAVAVDYDVLAAVTNAEEATGEGAPTLHEEAQDNVCFHWTVAGGDIDAAFAAADVIVSDHIVNQRLIPMAMEPRAALADWDPAMEELTIWVTSQKPAYRPFPPVTRHRYPGEQDPGDRPRCRRRLRQQDRPLPRRRHGRLLLPAGAQTRQVGSDPERGIPGDDARPRSHHRHRESRPHPTAKVLGLRAKVHANLGAYLSTASTGVPTILHGLMLSGAYTFGAIHEDVFGVFTNTVPVDAYRGAGTT